MRHISFCPYCGWEFAEGSREFTEFDAPEYVHHCPRCNHRFKVDLQY